MHTMLQNVNYEVELLNFQVKLSILSGKLIKDNIKDLKIDQFMAIFGSPGQSPEEFCTSPCVRIGVSISVHIYITVLLMAYIFQII